MPVSVDSLKMLIINASEPETPLLYILYKDIFDSPCFVLVLVFLPKPSAYISHNASQPWQFIQKLRYTSTGQYVTLP